MRSRVEISHSLNNVWYDGILEDPINLDRFIFKHVTQASTRCQLCYESVVWFIQTEPHESSQVVVREVSHLQCKSIYNKVIIIERIIDVMNIVMNKRDITVCVSKILVEASRRNECTYTQCTPDFTLEWLEGKNHLIKYICADNIQCAYTTNMDQFTLE